VDGDIDAYLTINYCNFMMKHFEGYGSRSDLPNKSHKYNVVAFKVKAPSVVLDSSSTPNLLVTVGRNTEVYCDGVANSIKCDGTEEYWIFDFTDKPEFSSDFINTMKLQLPKDQVILLMQKYMLDAYLYTIPAKANVVYVLKTLKARGAGLNVLTASPHITLDACLKRLGLWELFDNVWSCDDFHTTKADPQIYVMAAERIGKPVGEILFLDDNLNADITAKSAGMLVCGVYDESSKDYVAQMKAATDFYIFDFKELPELDILKKA